jgi:predicted O-methyltransferase YrrM
MRPEPHITREECSEPERWSAPDGIAAETAVSDFLGALVHLLKPRFVVETGTYLGDTACSIGTALKLEGRGRLVTLEINPGFADTARIKCADLPVTVLTMNSLDYVPEESVDLLFLDSAYTARTKEIRFYKVFCSPACVIVSHDTVVDSFRKDLDSLAEKFIVQPWVYFPVPRGLGITRFPQISGAALRDL